MFLSNVQILERLERGELRIDPTPTADSLSDCSVDLRLGEFFTQPMKAGRRGEVLYDPASVTTQQAKIGEEVILKAKSRLLATTLEFVTLPPDLLGFITVRSSLERLGITGSTLQVHPRFSGRLVGAIDNRTDWDIPLVAGDKAFHLTLAQVGQAPDVGQRILNHINVGSTLSLGQSVAVEKVSASGPVARKDWKSLVDQALTATGVDKGKALEQLVKELFSAVECLKVLKCNVHLKAEELDVLMVNEGGKGFWGIAGAHMIAECKNWSGKVGASDISIIFDKLLTLGPDAKTCFLIAPNGVTGEYYRDGTLKIREKRTAGKFIILIDKTDLEDVANGTTFVDVLNRSYFQLLMI